MTSMSCWTSHVVNALQCPTVALDLLASGGYDTRVQPRQHLSTRIALTRERLECALEDGAMIICAQSMYYARMRVPLVCSDVQRQWHWVYILWHSNTGVHISPMSLFCMTSREMAVAHPPMALASKTPKGVG